MRTTPLFLLSLIVGSATCQTVVKPTPSATVKGSCNATTVGNGNQVKVECGIPKEQAKDFVRLMNKALAARDTTSILKKMDVKLDELLEAEPKPGIEQSGEGNAQSSGSADCLNNAGNCAGVNNGTQQQIFGAPRPAPLAHFTLRSLPSGTDPNDPESPSKGMGGGRPGVELAIGTAGDFQSPTFRIVCDGGCVPISAFLYTRNGTDFQSISIHYRTAPDRSEPNGFFIKFTVPGGSLEQGQTIFLRFRSDPLIDPPKVVSVTSVTE